MIQMTVLVATVFPRWHYPSSDQSARSMEGQLPPVDAARIAKRVVAALRPAQGDRAIYV